MCEYCEPNKDNKCKPMMKCLDNLNGYERIKIHHVRPCKMCPTQDYWRLDCERFGVFVGVKINFCPMCGHKLKEADYGND
jgi:hypothetical protein